MSAVDPSSTAATTSGSDAANKQPATTPSLLTASSFTCHWCAQPAYSMILHAFPLSGDRFLEEVGTVTVTMTGATGDEKSRTSKQSQLQSMPLCRYHESQYSALLIIEPAIYTKQLEIDSRGDASVAASSASLAAWERFLHEDATGRAFAASGPNIVRDYDPDEDNEKYENPPHCRVCRLSDEGADGRDLHRLHSIGFGQAAPSVPRLMTESELKQVQYHAYDYWCDRHVDDMVRTTRIYSVSKKNLSIPQFDGSNYVNPDQPRLPNQ